MKYLTHADLETVMERHPVLREVAERIDRMPRPPWLSAMDDETKAQLVEAVKAHCLRIVGEAEEG